MKQVRFFDLSGDGFRPSGRAMLRDGAVVLEGFTKDELLLLNEGMVDMKDTLFPRKRWLPKDGLPFLELLPVTFRGSYFKASLIEEVEG